MTSTTKWLTGITGMIVIAVSAAVLKIDSGDSEPEGVTLPGEPPQQNQLAERAKVLTDPEEVFRRAFWRHPDRNDRIHHAVRKEWQDNGGVSRWHWAVEVSPSDGLKDYLFQENAFDLTKAGTEFEFSSDGMPEWFPTGMDRYSVYYGSGEGFLVLYLEEENRLFACSEGGGFSKANESPEPRVSVAGEYTKGRLPNSPPPIDIKE